MIPSIALDAMSGDYGPEVVVMAASQILSERDDLHIILVGDQTTLKQYLSHKPTNITQRLSIHHAAQRIEMDELPSHALRNKKESSMRVAVDLVKQGKANACVSAGNISVLMAIARYALGAVGGIDRPAIISTLPNMQETNTRMLDLGANVEVTPEHLFQFAVMGSVLARAIDNISEPRIGLLNIGQKEIKGNERIKETAKLLMSSHSMNYVGFVEGDDIFKGFVDVVVCDGLVGHVSLKTMEGVIQMINHYVEQSFAQNIMTRLAERLSRSIINELHQKFDPRNSASLLGLRGIVIKSHGSDALSFSFAIKEALMEVQENIPSQISQMLATLLSERRRIE